MKLTAKSFRLFVFLFVCLFMHALETWGRTQKLHRDFCFRKAGVLDPGTQPLAPRIRVLLQEALAAPKFSSR